MTEQLAPLGDRVLLRRIPQEERIGLIYLPDQSKEKAQVAEVVAVGPGRWNGESWTPTQVKPGQRVMFGKYSGTDLKLGQDELVVMREEDVLGILYTD